MKKIRHEGSIKSSCIVWVCGCVPVDGSGRGCAEGASR